MFLWSQLLGLLIICSVTQNSPLQFLLGLSASSRRVSRELWEDKGKQPDSVLFFSWQWRLPGKHCHTSVLCPSPSHWVQLQHRSAPCISLLPQLKEVTAANWFLPSSKTCNELQTVYVTLSQFFSFSSTRLLPLIHLQVFQWMAVLSDVFVCWAGNLLMNYGGSNCNFKGRDQRDLLCCHPSDITCCIFIHQ